MKRLPIIIMLLYGSVICPAQSGQWTWVHGPQLASNPNGNYGTRGVSAPSNVPPGRYQAAYWKDLNGNFWVFGGTLNGGNTFNDLWKFDPSIREWTWMHGPQLTNNVSGHYGVKGVSSPLNIPPARSWGANCWTGNDGKLYLFGGSNNGEFNDLWQYDIGTNEWTWIAGSNTMGNAANYGTQGVAASTNDPGARIECKSGWTINDELWMFGGWVGAVAKNDLWKYDLNTNLWTWESGSNVSPPPGNYGTQGVPASTNLPPGRASYTKWRQGNNKLYIFGGLEINGDFNDVWEYDLNTKLWTWLGGSSSQSQIGSVISLCDDNMSNIPRARFENQTVQTNNSCSRAFWSFGGFNNLTNTSSLNDLWIYDSDKNKWIMVWGDIAQVNIPSNYGTLGVSSSSNAIPPRGGVCVWTDDQENIWVFGGGNEDLTTCYNDMWQFEPDTNCFDIISANSSFNWPGELSICAEDTAELRFPVNTILNIQPTQSAHYDSSSGRLSLYPKSNMVYTITAKSPPNAPCPVDETKDINVVIHHAPIADFLLSPNTIFESSGVFKSINKSIDADTYKWTHQGSLISSTENFEKAVSGIGTYCFELEVSNACGSDQTTKCGEVLPGLSIPNAFTPNGDDNNDVFRLINPGDIDINYLRVFNRWGEQVFFTTDKNQGWDGSLRGVECETGTYFYILNIPSAEQDISFRGDVTLIR